MREACVLGKGFVTGCDKKCVMFLGCDTLFSSYCRSPVARCTEQTIYKWICCCVRRVKQCMTLV
jgi:hypothetical protein